MFDPSDASRKACVAQRHRHRFGNAQPSRGLAFRWPDIRRRRVKFRSLRASCSPDPGRQESRGQPKTAFCGPSLSDGTKKMAEITACCQEMLLVWACLRAPRKAASRGLCIAHFSGQCSPPWITATESPPARALSFLGAASMLPCLCSCGLAQRTLASVAAIAPVPEAGVKELMARALRPFSSAGFHSGAPCDPSSSVRSRAGVVVPNAAPLPSSITGAYLTPDRDRVSRRGILMD